MCLCTDLKKLPLAVVYMLLVDMPVHHSEFDIYRCVASLNLVPRLDPKMTQHYNCYFVKMRGVDATSEGVIGSKSNTNIKLLRYVPNIAFYYRKFYTLNNFLLCSYSSHTVI